MSTPREPKDMPTNGVEWDIFLVQRCAWLKDELRWIGVSDTRGVRAARTALWRVVERRVPDPKDHENATEWEWAETTAAHLFDVCTALAALHRAYGWVPGTTTGANADVLELWWDTMHVLHVFHCARRLHDHRIEALFETEATQ